MNPVNGSETFEKFNLLSDVEATELHEVDGGLAPVIFMVGFVAGTLFGIGLGRAAK